MESRKSELIDIYNLYPLRNQRELEMVKIANICDSYLKEINQLQSEKEELINAMHEIYEVWAGSEGIAETTASEAYQAHLIYQMRDIASKFKRQKILEKCDICGDGKSHEGKVCTNPNCPNGNYAT